MQIIAGTIHFKNKIIRQKWNLKIIRKIEKKNINNIWNMIDYKKRDKLLLFLYIGII